MTSSLKFLFALLALLLVVNLQFVHCEEDVDEDDDNELYHSDPEVNAFFSDIEKGNINRVKYHVEENGIDVNTRREGDKRTGLMVATQYADAELVRYLLSKEANPNTQDSEGNTALHIAAAENLGVIANILLQNGYV